jgi:adenosylcobyric acid synthase
MLGDTLEDPHAIESQERFGEGLGLLAFCTRFGREKRTTQVRARALADSASLLAADSDVHGYEIHMGRLERRPGARGAFAVLERNGRAERDIDGDAAGNVVGTMIHGLFDNASIRRSLLARLRVRKGLPAVDDASSPTAVDEYDRLADVIRANVDLGRLREIVSLESVGAT